MFVFGSDIFAYDIKSAKNKIKYEWLQFLRMKALE